MKEFTLYDITSTQGNQQTASNQRHHHTSAAGHSAGSGIAATEWIEYIIGHSEE